MEYPITEVKCPDCGEYLLDVGSLYACFTCGYERDIKSPLDALTQADTFAMMPDNDIHG